MRRLLPSVLLAMTLSPAAVAAPTAYIPNWSDSTGGGTPVGPVTMTTTLIGGATLYSAPSGPWIGSIAGNNAKLSFSAPVTEICVYIWWNNTGENLTLSTNGSGSDTYRAVDSGDVTTTITGAVFTWSDMGDADEALACIGNTAGFTEATFIHNGVGSGLVFGDEVVADISCTPTVWYLDDDGDGYGSATTDSACTAKPDFVATPGDCDDDDDSVYPGATEIPYDGIDQDCDSQDLCDVDEDGFDDPLCAGTDCDDDDATISPGADEVYYDGLDADCDGWSDYDADMDGYDRDVDCDDTDPWRSPGATERWYDGVDQDCSGGSDADQDGDGFDAVAHGGTDCDDLSDLTYPGAPELDDGLDNDCNGLAESDDFDEDGVSDELEAELGLDPDSDDSDGDGVLDRDELGDPNDPTDSDGDGLIDALDHDDDEDGIATAVEVEQSLKTNDSDEDGLPDYLDPDSDNDGFDDIDEGDVDSDFDGVADYIDVDSDEDGVADADEFDGDSDQDGIPDRLDPDDDGDGVPTSQESSWTEDLDGDGVPNHLDEDSDGDGIPDSEEGWSDADCDGVMDVTEADAGDGPCAQEIKTGFQGRGCSASNAPAGLAGMGVGLWLVLGLRRRRTATRS